MKMFFKRPRDFIKRNAETISLAVFMTFALTETCYATLEKTTGNLKAALDGNIASIIIMGGLIFGIAKALFSGNVMLAVAVVGCVILFVIAKMFVAEGFVLFAA